ncbi:hypothetical protein [Microcystis aeruginosa]|nr:hypothetical protein [Microcystis aeruginosa]
MINTRLKPVTTGLIGAVGLGVALLGMPEAVKATTVVAGTDYLFTHADFNTFYDFGGSTGKVYFKGVPTFAGGSDTKVQRKDNCTFVSGSCTTAIEMTGLELMSFSPNSVGNILATIDPLNPSTGTMTIYEDGTFESILTVNAVATGGILPAPVTFTKEFKVDRYNSSNPDGGRWTGTPLPGTPLVRAAYPDQDANCHNLTGPGCLNTDVTGDGMTDTDFFLAAGVLHIAPPYGDTHRVYPHRVPEPSAVLGLIAVGLSSIVGFKGKKEPK